MTGGAQTETRDAAISDREFAAFSALVLRETGISLSDTKRQLVCSRLARRLRALGCPGYEAYYERVTQHDPDGVELQHLINCITTNKTDFFREPHHFDFLADQVFARHRGGRPLRIWSAGCSTGEEPYTLAMVAREHYGPRAPALVQILASDIDTEVLRRAATGVYAAERTVDLEQGRVRRHFLRGAGAAQGQLKVRPEVRELVTFRQINLANQPWPLADSVDLIFCRNVIIYFNRETQDTLMRGFAARLRPGGHLVLGHSENLMWLSDLFEPLGQTVYRVRPARGPARPLPALRARSTAPKPEPDSIRLVAGDVRASADPVVFRTVLGSCVAACLYDPVAGVGGMNHFLLPDGNEDPRMPNRFGVHAMELLINEIMRLGGDRRRLQAKVFGASNVLEALQQQPTVARRNAQFVRRFLETEQIPILAEKLEGRRPMEVRFHTRVGRVQVRDVEPMQLREEPLEIRRYLRRLERGAMMLMPHAIVLFGESA